MTHPSEGKNVKKPDEILTSYVKASEGKLYRVDIKQTTAPGERFTDIDETEIGAEEAAKLEKEAVEPVSANIAVEQRALPANSKRMKSPIGP